MNYAKKQAKNQIKATHELIETSGIQKLLLQVRLATGFFAEQKTLINSLSALTVCRRYAKEGTVTRQEIDALHAQVWDQLVDSVKHYY